MVSVPEKNREKLLWRQFKRFDDANARNELVRMYEALARSIARKYARKNQEEDVLQVARLGLIKAVDRFDLSTGFAFSSFAVPTIAGEIKRYFRDRTWIVRPPRNIQELGFKVYKCQKDYFARHGKAMPVSEIAVELDVAEEDILEAGQASFGRIYTSFDTPIGEDSSLGDILFDSKDFFAQPEARIDLERLISVLNERDRLVVNLRFFEEFTQAEIGEVIGASQMQVSRILRAACEKMRLAAEGVVLQSNQEETGQMGRNKVGDNPKLQKRVMDALSKVGDFIDGQVVNVLHEDTGLPAGTINQVIACMERDGLVKRSFNEDRTKIVSLQKCGGGAPVMQSLVNGEAKAPARSALPPYTSIPLVGVAATTEISSTVRELVDFLAVHGRVSSDSGQATTKLAELMGLSYGTVAQRLNKPEAKRYIDRKVAGKRTYWHDLTEEGCRAAAVPATSDSASGPALDEELSFGPEHAVVSLGDISLDPPADSRHEGNDSGQVALASLSRDLVRVATEIANLAGLQEKLDQAQMEADQARDEVTTARVERDKAHEQLRITRNDLERIRVDLQKVQVERDSAKDELYALQARLAELAGLPTGQTPLRAIK